MIQQLHFWEFIQGEHKDQPQKKPSTKWKDNLQNGKKNTMEMP